MEQKRLTGAGDTGEGKKKKGKKGKKILIKETGGNGDASEPSPAAAVVAVPCNVCGKEADKKCKCMVAKYCSRECQVSDWKKHKKVCLANPKNVALLGQQACKKVEEVEDVGEVSKKLEGVQVEDAE